MKTHSSTSKKDNTQKSGQNKTLNYTVELSLPNVPHLGEVGAKTLVYKAWIVEVGEQYELDPAFVIRVGPRRHEGLGVHVQFAEYIVQLVQYVLPSPIRQQLCALTLYEPVKTMLFLLIL